MHRHGAMHSSLRCGARTRSGTPCRSPAVADRKRCRMHGGAPGSGAPRGNRNARKHGFWSSESIHSRRQLAAMLREATSVIEAVD